MCIIKLKKKTIKKIQKFQIQKVGNYTQKRIIQNIKKVEKIIISKLSSKIFLCTHKQSLKLQTEHEKCDKKQTIKKWHPCNKPVERRSMQQQQKW